MNRPKLRSADKYDPLYPLNSFPSNFPYLVAESIIYTIATQDNPRIIGSDWEEIFAKSIGAEWTPSNIGLDDVVNKQMAWGAKTVKNTNPFSAKKVRLISGRNSLAYSFGEEKVLNIDPNLVGPKVLDIWNERVTSTRAKYRHLRTVVLIKGIDLRELTIFETETSLYIPEQFSWEWNSNNNLIATDVRTGKHKFTWQPHGSQFTIIEEVPNKRLNIRLLKSPRLVHEDVMRIVGFNESWVELVY